MAESCFTSEIYALYTIGSLDGVDLSDFTRHIGQGCEICRGELSQAYETWTYVAAATPPVTPPAYIRERILARARNSALVAMPVRRPLSYPWWQQAAAAILILGIGVGVGWNLRKPIPVPVATPAPASAPPVAEVRPAPAPPPAAPTAPDERAERENRELRARIAELDKTIAAQEARIRAGAPLTQEIADLQAQLARAQAEAQTNAQTAQQAQTRARDAEQRFQTADAERKQAVDRESRLRETTTARLRQLEAENEKFRRVIDDQQRRIQQNTQLVAFFSNPNLKFYQYQGTRNGPSARAHVVMQAGNRAVFYAFHLPQLPAGRTYQLWLIRGQSPAIVSGGIFHADANGNAIVQFSDASMLKDIRQFAVTDEPEGGSPGPTGKQFFRAAS